MIRWALIEGGAVANVVEQVDQPQIGGLWVACGNAAPGWLYDGAQFSDPAAPQPARWGDPGLEGRYLWIDVGPWRDRFGMDWLALSTSEHRLARAAVAAWSERKYIDLVDPRNAQLLGALVAAGLPDAAPEIPGSGPLTPAKVEAILTPRTTERERHVKGLPQPEGD